MPFLLGLAPSRAPCLSPGYGTPAGITVLLVDSLYFLVLLFMQSQCVGLAGAHPYFMQPILWSSMVFFLE